MKYFIEYRSTLENQVLFKGLLMYKNIKGIFHRIKLINLARDLQFHPLF